MTGSSSSSSDKPSSTINIKHVVPLVLDLDRMNYDIWRELFETHCLGFGVAHHLQPPKAKEIDDTEWIRVDSIVKSWLYSTLAQPLLHMILKKKAIAHSIWVDLEKLFRDNKENKALQLESELRNITMGDSLVTDYCTRIKTIADLLENLDAPVPKRNLVSYTLSGLTKKFQYIATTIRHQRSVPSFMDTRSMLLMEEHQMLQDDQKIDAMPHSDHSSSPTLLATDGSYQHQNNSRGPNNFRGGRGGRNGRGGRGGRSGGNRSGGTSQPRHHPHPPVGWAYGWYQVQQQQPTQQGLLPNPASSAQQHFSGSKQSAQQPHFFFGPPSVPVQQAFVSPHHVQQLHEQPTAIPEMFNAMSLNDPAMRDGTWIPVLPHIFMQMQVYLKLF